VTTDRIGPPPALAVDRAGDGPLVFFLHGIGGNRTNWRDQLPVFAARYTAAAWDARGYGGSDDDAGPLAFDEFAADLERVLDHYRVSRAHLVGLSMGGRIAMRFYFLHPERIATLTLCDTHRGFASLSAEQRVEYVRIRRDALAGGLEPRDIAPTVVPTLLGPAASPAARQQLFESMATLRKASYLKSLEATVNQDTVGDLAAIAVPTHFVVGEHDRLTTVSLAQAMAAEVSGAELTVIPDAGHLSNIENPDAFNRSVMDFLARHPGADPPRSPAVAAGRAQRGA